MDETVRIKKKILAPGLDFTFRFLEVERVCSYLCWEGIRVSLVMMIPLKIMSACLE